MQPQPEETHQIALGTVLEQSRTNSTQISELGKRLDNFAASVNSAIEAMSLRIGKSQRTDWQTIFVGCSLVITLLAMPIYFLKENQASSEARNKEKSAELDIKLQREFALALETLKEGLGNVNTISKERHDQAVRLTVGNSDRIKSLEDWERQTIRADLDELRQWRLKGKP